MVSSSSGYFDHSRDRPHLSLTLLGMWREPDVLEARGAHRIDHVVVHPWLADYVGDRVVEENPRRVGYDDFLGLIVERIALFHVGDRLGFTKQRLDLGIGIEAVVVGTPLRAREERSEKIFRIRKVSFPTLQERLRGARLANRFEEGAPRDRLQLRVDSQRREVLLYRLPEH